jgi:hypothetical protein
LVRRSARDGLHSERPGGHAWLKIAGEGSTQVIVRASGELLEDLAKIDTAT